VKGVPAVPGPGPDPVERGGSVSRVGAPGVGVHAA